MSKRISLKNRIRHFLIEKNSNVHKAFNAALNKRNPGIARKFNPFLWLYLFYLNVKFRVFKRKDALAPEAKTAAPAKKKTAAPAKKKTTTSSPNTPNVPVQEGFSRIPQNKLYQRIEKCDVLSLDLLGTMVSLPFASMYALYRLCEIDNGIANFAKIRIDAEKKAKAKFGSRVSIEDIYDFVYDSCGLSQKEGISQEEAKILSLVEPNAYIKILYDFHIVTDKPVIIMADTYLMKEFVERILEKCGYKDVHTMYLSSELEYSKADKRMYETALEDFNGQSIFHIGNDSILDIKNAKEKGIAVSKYTSVHKLASSFSYESVTPFHRSVFAGIANNHFYSWETKQSVFYEYGFVCGGPIVSGFCAWLHAQIKATGVDRIIFVDGPQSVLQAFYTKQYPEEDVRFLCWSSTLALRHNGTTDNSLWLYRLLRMGTDLQNELVQALFVLYPDLYTSEAKRMESIEFLLLHKEELLDMLQSDRTKVLDMVYQNTEGAKKIALVGWQGGQDGPLSVKRMIHSSKDAPCDIRCYSLFSIDETHDPATEDIYTVSSSQNRDGYAALKKTKKQTTNMLELVSGTWMPDLIGIRQDGGYLFDIPDAEKHWRFREVSDGIDAFIEIYEGLIEALPDFPAISGTDAYRAHSTYFQHAIKQKKNHLFSFVDKSDKTRALTSFVESYVIGKRGM